MNEHWSPLDEELAEKVMGWKMASLSDPEWKDWWPTWPRTTRMRLEPACDGSEELQPRPIPHFTSNIVNALQILDRMRELGHRWLLNADTEGFHLRRVVLVKHDLERDEKSYVVDRPLGWARSLEDLPKIICEAALKEIKSV